MTTVEQPGAGWDALASDGSVVRIRRLREGDEPALDAMNRRVSDRSMYLRFFGINRSSADEHTHHLATDHDGHVALVAEVTPRPGAPAIAAQSGAVGIAVLDQAARTGLGISEFVSLGNKVDVSGNDLLLHWWGDPRTTVIGLYLESFGRLSWTSSTASPGSPSRYPNWWSSTSTH